jgi:hypothetical protein
MRKLLSALLSLSRYPASRGDQESVAGYIKNMLIATGSPPGDIRLSNWNGRSDFSYDEAIPPDIMIG